MTQQSTVGTLLKYGLIVGGGYWLYTRFMSGQFGAIASPATSTLTDGNLQAAAGQQAQPGGGATATQPGAISPPPQTVWPEPTPAAAATLVERLNAAATGNTLFTTNAAGELVAPNFDHWNFYRNQLEPPELTGAEFDAIVRASGLPGPRGDNATARQFVDALKTVRVGIAGLGAVVIPLPLVTRDLSGRPTVIWAARRLQGARG